MTLQSGTSSVAETDCTQMKIVQLCWGEDGQKVGGTFKLRCVCVGGGGISGR